MAVEVSRRAVLAGAALSGMSVFGSPALGADQEQRQGQPRFPGDPGKHKLYYGESRQGGDPADREAYCGHRLGIYRSYWQASQTASMVAVCKRDTTAGRLPFASTKLPATWADVASGRQNKWLHATMDGLATVPGPVWLCLHHEPYDDQGLGQSPHDYVAMYRRAYAVKPSNVAMVPILQAAPFDSTVNGHADITPWYDASVTDVVGIDTYNHWYPGGTNKWRNPATVASFFDVLASTYGKPIALAEHGVRTDPADVGKAAQWMSDLQALLVGRGDVVAMSVFDSGQNVNDGGTDWSLDYNGDTERLDSFKALLRAPGSTYVRGGDGPQLHPGWLRRSPSRHRNLQTGARPPR